MSDLQNKLAAGVRAAREDQDKDGKAPAGEPGLKKDTSTTPASAKPRPADSTKPAATRKAATGTKAGARKTSARKSTTRRKTATKATAKAPAKQAATGKPAGARRSTGGRAPQKAALDPNNARATADEPWKNLHPNRIWPD
ncbi:MAG: hypothetical protein ACQETK_07885 [Pseudomonadota bacterium]